MEIHKTASPEKCGGVNVAGLLRYKENIYKDAYINLLNTFINLPSIPARKVDHEAKLEQLARLAE